MKKKFRRLLCATLAILMLSVLNINPIATIADAIASSGIGDRLSALFENIGSASKSLTAKADGDTYYNTYNYYGGGDEDSDAGSIAEAVMEIKEGNSLHDIWYEEKVIEEQYLKPILDELKAQNHEYRVAHLISLNNMTTSAKWRPTYEEVPYIKDIAMVNGKFTNVYTGSWDTNRSTVSNSGSRSMDSIVTTRAREVLGYDCDVRVEGLIFRDHGNETVIKDGATNDNTHTEDPQTAYLVKLYQQTMPKENVYWIDAVTLLYKALGQEQVTYSGFMHKDNTITPETSPAFQGLSNPAPNEDGTYNGYLYYMFLTRNNTVVSDLGIDGVARGDVPTTYKEYKNYVYWNKALNAGFIPADKQKDFNKPITFRDFYQLAASMMQAYGEPVMNDDELKALLQVYGTHYPIQLGTDVADAWAYLAARGIFDFNPITEGKESILYDVVNTSTISLDQLLLMCTRIKDKNARTDFKEINITLDLSDVMKEDYYFPVKDLKMSDSLSGVTTYDYTKRQYYDYLILKNDYTNLGAGALAVSTDPDDPSCIVGGRVDVVEVQGKEYYHIKLPINTSNTVYIINTKVEDFGTYTAKDVNTNASYIEVPASLPDGGIFSGSIASGDSRGRTVNVNPERNDYLKFSALSGTDGTAIYCDSARAGRRDVQPTEPDSTASLLENIAFFINLWTTPMIAHAEDQYDHDPTSIANAMFVSAHGKSLDEMLYEIGSESGTPDYVKEARKNALILEWNGYEADAKQSGSTKQTVTGSGGSSSSGGGGSSSSSGSGSGSGNGSGGGSTNTTKTEDIGKDAFRPLQFKEPNSDNAYLTQEMLEQAVYGQSNGDSNNKFIYLKPGNIDVKDTWAYTAATKVGERAARITAMSDAGYTTEINSNPNLAANELWIEPLDENKVRTLAQFVYKTPTICSPAVGLSVKHSGNPANDILPEPVCDPTVLQTDIMHKHYEVELLEDAKNFVTEIRTNSIDKSYLSHGSTWEWTVTSSSANGAQSLVDNVLGAVSTGDDLAAVDSELGATIYTSVIMNRNKQVLISWSDMVKNGFVTITKGLANDTPVPDDTGRYLFYAPETEGVIIVNDIMKTIQVGTTVYDFSSSNVKHLVYHDPESKETYFDIRSVVGVSEFDFAENKDAHVSFESNSSLGSGSYAIWTYTTDKLFTKHKVNLYGVEERNAQNPLEVVLMENTAWDRQVHEVDVPNSPNGEKISVTYWPDNKTNKSITRMKMSSFVPTANWCVFMSEGTQSTDLVARCYIWYPRQPFASGYIEVDQTDMTVNTLPNSWDDTSAGGIRNYLSLQYNSASAVRQMTDGIVSSDGKRFEDLFKLATGKTIEEAMDPESPDWYDRMNCASCADLWHYGHGKYFMSPDYVMRAVDISYNNALQAYGNNYKGISNYTVIQGPQDAGYMYFIDKVGYVYNLPYDEDFTYEKYFNAEYLLPLAIDCNGMPTMYNYNINYYSSYIAHGGGEGTSPTLPYGCVFTDKPTVSASGDRLISYPIVNARGAIVDSGGECDSAFTKNARNPFPLNNFVPAPAGVYAYIGYNNVQLMKLSEANRYIVDSTRIYYGASRLTYIQTSGATANNRDIQFTLVSQQYPAISIDRNSKAQRVYQGKQDVFIIPNTRLYASEGQGSYNITADDYGTNPLMDWFSKLGLSDLLLAIDKGASWIVVFVFKVLPIIGVILMTILVGLSFLGDNKLVKEICEKTVDPVKILTFGRQTIETWKWQKVLLPCILLYVLFALFLNGNIIRIIMWFASLGGSAVNWVMK